VKKAGLDFATYFEEISSCWELKGAIREVVSTGTQCSFKLAVDT